MKEYDNERTLSGRYYEVEEITSLKQMLQLSVDRYADRPAFLVKKERRQL